MVMCWWPNHNSYSLRINGLQNPNQQTKGLRMEEWPCISNEELFGMVKGWGGGWRG